MNKEDYNNLTRVLEETPVGNSFGVTFQSPTDREKESMQAVTHFLIDNKAEELDMYTEIGGMSTRKYNIQGKIFFLKVWIDLNKLKNEKEKE